MISSFVAFDIDTLAVIACVALTAAVLIFVFMIKPDLRRFRSATARISIVSA